MKESTKKIIAVIIMALPAAMLVMSAGMKLSGSEAIMNTLGKTGIGPYITLLGIIELSSVILLFIKKTFKIGLLLVTGYLGGAISIELFGGQFPVAAILLSVIWTGAFLRDKQVFLN